MNTPLPDQAPNRAEAQRRADEIRIFNRELDRLAAEGVPALDDAQRRRIDEHHRRLLAGLAAEWDIDRDARAGRLSLGMRVASFLGALALAASVFFLFYQFWGHFTTATQVTILIAAALGSAVATFAIRAREHNGYFTRLAAMTAFACFVLNIAMLGQIFNIAPSDKALLVWGAYALLLAYACDLPLLLAMGIGSLLAFVSARIGTWGGLYWLDFARRPENVLPAAVLLFLVPLYVDHARHHVFPLLYRVAGLAAFFVPVLVLSFWGEASYLDIDSDVVEGGYQFLGLAGSAAAIWLGARRGWHDTVNTGTVFFVVFLYARLFDWWWDSLPNYLFFLLVALVAILLLLVMRRLRAGMGAAAEDRP
ncbi:MAG: DUF2157 domain-containing protein [Pseudomonadota bacterium]